MGILILVIDNYDSFVYNLVQYFGILQAQVEVVRNDKITIREITKKKPEYIVISPGPGKPDDAGICLDLIRFFSGKIPVLGICLGHQSIGQAFGAKICRCKEVYHGKTSVITHKEKGILKDIPIELEVARYHSLEVTREGLPKELEITAVTKNGEIMGLQHINHSTYGLQFHPESIASQYGLDILRNFLK